MPKYISLPLPLPDSFTRLTRSTPSESSRSPPSRKKRNGRRNCRDWSPQSSPQRLKTWAQEVLQILDKPTVAVCVFIFGVFIIVVASKQLKVTFDILEYYWGGGRPQDGFIGNFMVIFVFMYVWIDTVILQWLKGLFLTLYAFLSRRFHQMKDAWEKVQEAEELEILQKKKLLRRTKKFLVDEEDECEEM